MSEERNNHPEPLNQILLPILLAIGLVVSQNDLGALAGSHTVVADGYRVENVSKSISRETFKTFTRSVNDDPENKFKNAGGGTSRIVLSEEFSNKSLTITFKRDGAIVFHDKNGGELAVYKNPTSLAYIIIIYNLERAGIPLNWGKTLIIK